MPDYVACDYGKHAQVDAQKRLKEIAKEDPEDLLP